MNAWTWIAVLAAVATPAVSFGQGAGGAAGNYLRTIRNVDVGTGYTVDGINSGVLNFGRANVGAQPGIANFQVFNTSVSSGAGRSTTANAPLFGVPGGFGGQKPFAGASNGSTVSPYLNLFLDTGASVSDNYNTLVRPQLEQQAVNRELQRQTQQLNRQVQQISARPAFEPQGNDQIFSTGHRTLFNYRSHFYPATRPAGGQRR